MPTAPSPGPAPAAFDPGRAWDLHPRVSVRPEPFGALLYHFDTRRLSFLKDRLLLDVVRALDGRPSARAACEHAGVPAGSLPRYERALAALAAGGMLVPRGVDGRAR
ncbi:mycofactocin biosynthesis chaperone MftB [Nocardiopsis composta]|uniref:Putative mycofactocin binding protein MftB n=1 Tax=Nocardiopsis composta TaxID=157465 RepID=A0A7W8QIF2_9ACTN|nr:mycofactocin biosynthesis chaperone MftB [Nocardiopsis composta]MBB5430338.1 putative mycofactocin binding protein MftB [Nocardiopsis composta]